MSRLFALILSLFLVGNASAADYTDPNVATQARQDQFEDIKASFKQLRFILLQKEFDVISARAEADKLAALSQPLLEMFRVRSDHGDTKALGRIWDSWPRFEAQMLKFIELTEKTAQSLELANQEDARMFVNQAAKSCKSCHRFFKKR